jgi:hypothetical protein
MAIFSTSQPGIRARLLPRFPAQVLAGTGITITKSGGTYVFAAVAIAELPLSSLQTMPTGTIVGRDTGIGPGPPGVLNVSGGLVFTGAGGIGLATNQRMRSMNALFPTVAASAAQDFSVAVACTIRRVTLLANPSGTVVVDIWKTTFAGYPPTAANSICAAAKPTISPPGSKFQDATLTGWTTNVLAGDTIRIVVESIATITRLTVVLDAEVI